MARLLGSKNKATVIREFFEKTLEEVSMNDYQEMTAAIVEKAKDGSTTAYRIISENMKHIIELESKEKETSTGIRVVINRDGIVVEGGMQGAGGVVDDGGIELYQPDQNIGLDQSQTVVDIPNIVLGSHTLSQSKKFKEEYSEYVGPLIVKERQHEGAIAHRFEPEKLYTYKGEIMGLGDICRMEKIAYAKVQWLMKRWDMDIEEAVQEVIDMTVIE